jgi:sec-independent protein translocase protein TatA
MFGMGPTEMIIALVVVLLLFGAKRIPEIAGSFGKGIREFKKNMNDVQREIAAPADRDALPPVSPRETVQHDDSPAKEPKRLI